jgi:hypothetical protein
MTLRWQLAELYEREGDIEKAEELLKGGAELAKSTADEQAASRRLNALRQAQSGAGGGRDSEGDATAVPGNSHLGAESRDRREGADEGTR